MGTDTLVSQGMNRITPWLHPLLEWRYPQALWRGDPRQHEVALTFDDGPHATDTPALLELLDRYAIPATFFWLGTNIEAHPDLVAAAAAAGHQIGIHGYEHKAFPLTPAPTLRRQLDQTRALITAASNQPAAAVCYVRPPYGVFNADTLRDMVAWGYRPVMWSTVPFHWLQTTQEAVTQVGHEVYNGAIIVLHEGHADSPPVVQIAESVIGNLRAQGYRFVTIAHLWQIRRPD
jgi:peptidoglycan/xylan/chitin deacetylase (PgdA/CDA1 family)